MSSNLEIMFKHNLYLKPNVLPEALFNQWRAWSYLVSPASSAIYVVKFHLKLLRSFIASPKLHTLAKQNPDMNGGPFIDYSEEYIEEARKLLEETVTTNKEIIEFVSAIETLEKSLKSEAVGYSLEDFYQQIPKPLEGFVELIYDLNNNPSIRFIEGLLFHSSYYKKSSQSVVLSLINQDDRPFSLTTPWLKRRGDVHLPIAFQDERLDKLFEMKRAASSYDYIKKLLEVESDTDFLSLFTEEAPIKFDLYQGIGVRIRYFGHACLLIETSEISILIDPIISYKYRSEVPRFTFEDLPNRIDYILITHNHQDHVWLETLLQLKHKTCSVIVPKNGDGIMDPSLKLMFKHLGFKNVVAIDEVEEILVKGGRLVGIPFLGEHGDLSIRSKIAYFIELKGRSVLCVADSNNLQPTLYTHIQKLIGDLDVLFIGMECDGAPLSWLYGPFLSKPIKRGMDQSRRLNGSDFKDASNMVNCFSPVRTYIYAMGQEPWLKHLTSISYTENSRPIIESNKLIQECTNKGKFCKRLYAKEEIILH
jgi:L-ascorbate metabolism protein UlaG (beta-lactamase superfamily)